MISMTGYGRAEEQTTDANVVVEVKSVNNRYLDINVTLPGSLGALELPVRERIAQACNRGRVDVFIRYHQLEEELVVRVDHTALSGYLSSLEELRSAAGITDPITLDHLLQREGILHSERAFDTDAIWERIEPVLDRALLLFRESREGEGLRLRADIVAQIALITGAFEEIQAAEGEIERQVKKNLRDRFAEVVGEGVEESRMLAEVAVQLTRFTIHEEIVRLAGHLESFTEALDSSEPVGKTLDFRCQEMHREINTIGSKSIVHAISEQVIQAKQAIENVREQLRNVE